MKEIIRARHLRANAILHRLNTIRTPKVVEVGVLVGGLSEILLASRKTLNLVMVDSWAPADQLPDTYRATGDVHANQTAAQAEANYREALDLAMTHCERATIVRLPSIKAAKAAVRDLFDMVFLDADHSYEAVKADLAAWLPAIKSGGWIGGHDYDHTDPQFHFGVKQAVDEWAAANGLSIERDADFTWFCRLP